MRYAEAMRFLGSVRQAKVTADEIDIDWSDDGLAEKQAARYLCAYIHELEGVILRRAPNPEQCLDRLRAAASEQATKE